MEENEQNSDQQVKEGFLSRKMQQKEENIIIEYLQARKMGKIRLVRKKKDFHKGKCSKKK